MADDLPDYLPDYPIQHILNLNKQISTKKQIPR